ncbi:methyltransferase [Sphingosinicellaceae bacterium]|nr:methyltransferase [Sphingosinicellaceae bacterium]
MKMLFGAVLLALAAPALAQAPVRPAEDIARDAARKPADMVAFAGIKPGSKVADMIPGGGYFTRIFAAAVGPTGHVTAIIPEAAEAAYPDQSKAVRALATTGYPNVSVVGHVTDPSLSGTLDVFWTAQNYHDLHNSLPPEAVVGFDMAVFAALKKGGVFVIVDHAAAAGSGLSATKTLHRIDPAVVKAEVVSAGFVFDGESKVLANPADPHTAIVFDPSIRGKTDQFVYRFRKP